MVSPVLSLERLGSSYINDWDLYAASPFRFKLANLHFASLAAIQFGCQWMPCTSHSPSVHISRSLSWLWAVIFFLLNRTKMLKQFFYHHSPINLISVSIFKKKNWTLGRESETDGTHNLNESFIGKLLFAFEGSKVQALKRFWSWKKMLFMARQPVVVTASY